KSQQETLNAIGKDVLALKDEKEELKAQVADLERRVEDRRREQRAVKGGGGPKRSDEWLDQFEQELTAVELRVRVEKFKKPGQVKDAPRQAAPEAGVNVDDAIKAAQKAAGR